jgi:hypothetical protein
MMPVIRISNRTWKRLQALASPFEDTPDDVILRLLDVNHPEARVEILDHADEPKAQKGTRIPQEELKLLLLRTVQQLGGSAVAKKVRNRMEKTLEPRLAESDLQPSSGGQPRWWTAVSWVRVELVKDGLLRADSKRGIWTISDAGESFLSQNSQSNNRPTCGSV